jgi:hypothetical protein
VWCQQEKQKQDELVLARSYMEQIEQREILRDSDAADSEPKIRVDGKAAAAERRAIRDQRLHEWEQKVPATPFSFSISFHSTV